MSALSRPEFHNETKAFEHLESIVWTDRKSCPHCGALDRLTKVTANPAKRIREGLWRCGHCKGQFTAKIGTVFEHARIPLHKMLQATYLMTSSKKGISAHQLHRILEITYKSAWFLAHRIREAMASDDLSAFGQGGGIVEVDETFIGHKAGVPKARAYHHKMKVLALVDRDTGKARTMVVDDVTAATIMPIVKANVAKEALVMTDESRIYTKVGAHFAGHGTTNHSVGQYVDYEIPEIHTNTIEGYFSIFKRGMKGVYQHCGEKHLHRYLAEYEFRYNNRIANGVDDRARSHEALRGIVGKRLTYARPR
jgi:transposase-like protein